MYATGHVGSTAEDMQRFARELLAPEMREHMLRFVGGKGQYGMPELEDGLGVMRNRAALWYGQNNGIVVALGVNQASTDPHMLATRLFDPVLDYR